jgi:hypothetical protein
MEDKMVKIHVMLNESSVDPLAKMLIGYALHMDPLVEKDYQHKLMCTIEFLEEVLDPSFQSVAIYINVMNLLPDVVKRKIPYKIQEFIDMYHKEIEKVLGGPVPAKYIKNRSQVLDVKPTIVDTQGNALI